MLAVGGDALALQVAQVRGDRLALDALQLDDARLDDDAARPVAHAASPRLTGRRLPAAVALKRRRSLAPASACIEAPARLALSP